MKLGRNQLIVVLGSLVVIASGAAGFVWMQPDQAKEFASFVADFGKWSIGFVVVGSAAIKTAAAIKGGQ